MSYLSQPLSLFCPGFGTLLLTPNSDLVTWVVELDALTGCQLTYLSLSDNKNVTGQVVECVLFSADPMVQRAGSFGKNN